MECSVLTKFVFELIGTMVMILMGDGVCACVTLNKSKGQNSGWVVITLAWGLAVMCGVLIAGLFPWNLVAPYVVAQMMGGALGAVMVWAVYKDHYDATPDGDAKLGTFCTIPAIRNYGRNCFVEMVATLVLVGIIIGFSTAGNKAGLAALGPIPVTLLIVALGMSLGGPTGYAMNPARDLSPRIVHALLPLKNKRDSDWAYAWVPVVGPLLGAAIAGALGLIWLAI